jgi:hypothetical protein
LLRRISVFTHYNVTPQIAIILLFYRTVVNPATINDNARRFKTTLSVMT